MQRELKRKFNVFYSTRKVLGFSFQFPRVSGTKSYSNFKSEHSKPTVYRIPITQRSNKVVILALAT